MMSSIYKRRSVPPRLTHIYEGTRGTTRTTWTRGDIRDTHDNQGTPTLRAE